jgi:hypothetical protein
VEEASIGLPDGPEPQLFGAISGIGMTQGRIFVLDHQLRLIRSYDANGNHLSDCGGPGQGPAELDPSTFYTELGTSLDGLIFAHAGNELEIFTADCEHVETRAIDERFTLGAPMVVTDEGSVYLSVPLDRTQPPDAWVYGMQLFSSEGRSGEPIPQPRFSYEPDEIEVRQRMNNGTVVTSQTRAPYTPTAVWAMLPSGAMVGGVSTSYRFEIVYTDGRRTVAERTVEPVQLAADEADWHARRFRATLSERSVDPPSWDASELADVKPAFDRFLGDRSGRVWVLRRSGGERIAGCDEDAETSAEYREAPCWEDTTSVDVFDADGRYLGSVNTPDDMSWAPLPYIRDDTVLATAQDDAGTIMVKRYRLVLPGEQ